MPYICAAAYSIQNAVYSVRGRVASDNAQVGDANAKLINHKHNTSIMKKTMIALLALSGVAVASITTSSDDITVRGESSLTIDNAFLTANLTTPTHWTDIDNQCKVGSFYFRDYTAADSLSLTFDTTIGLYQLEITHPGTLNLTFNNGAAVYTSSTTSYTNDGGNANNHVSYGTNRPETTISVSLTDSQMEVLIADKVLTYSLIHTSSAWNNEKLGSLTLANVSALDAMNFTNKGVISSAADLQEFEYGLINTNSGMTLVAKTPEPATATLSLLALAGLASRRRRH